MILWINGAFGAGKTTVANELNRRIENSYIYDPENAGYFIRKNIPQQINTEDNFQDYKLWRDFNLKMLRFIADSFDGTIIVPMTVTNRQYYD
jgi:adenylylsulfate kinase-like enzyme